MQDLNKTVAFSMSKETDNTVSGILRIACSAMREKGYDPVKQIVGYIVSGDPTYITSHKSARALIHKLDRDELLEELVSCYIKNLE